MYKFLFRVTDSTQDKSSRNAGECVVVITDPNTKWGRKDIIPGQRIGIELTDSSMENAEATAFSTLVNGRNFYKIDLNHDYIKDHLNSKDPIKLSSTQLREIRING